MTPSLGHRPRIVVLRDRRAGAWPALLVTGAAWVAWTLAREAEVAALLSRVRAADDALAQERTAWTLTPDERERQAPQARSDEATRLARRIDALFAEVHALARGRRVEELIDAFTRLRPLLQEAERHPLLRARLADWTERLSWGEGPLRPRLQVAITRGNQALRAMASALRREEWDAVDVAHRDLTRTADDMDREEREVFRRNAAALRARGDALRRRSMAIQEAAVARRPPDDRDPSPPD